jgi:hypothetical protein
MQRNSQAYIFSLLVYNSRAVERAMIAIYNRQTEDEQIAQDTKHSNGKGFAASDARLGSYYAKWVLSGKQLTGSHLDKARQMSFKYIRQLAEVANEKMAKAVNCQA